MEIVKESSIIKELIQEGYEKGIEKGERQATLEALHQTLTIRFEVERGKFDERFERLEVESLKTLNEAALTAQNLAEFEKVLADMLSKLGEI